MGGCPFDFLTDFDRWFLWQKFVEFDGLSPGQATVNVGFVSSGWRLVDGFKYGMWVPDGVLRRKLYGVPDFE